jgi:hypothetical protein
MTNSGLLHFAPHCCLVLSRITATSPIAVSFHVNTSAWLCVLLIVILYQQAFWDTRAHYPRFSSPPQQRFCCSFADQCLFYYTEPHRLNHSMLSTQVLLTPAGQVDATQSSNDLASMESLRDTRLRLTNKHTWWTLGGPESCTVPQLHFSA